MNIWQKSTRYIIALILAALFFGIGAHWERRRQSKLPRIYFHVQAIPAVSPAREIKKETFFF